MDVHANKSEPWRVTVVDTGEATMTGGRLKRVAKYLDGDFCMTYGDGVTDADIGKIIEQHQARRQACDADGGATARALRHFGT